MSNQGFRKQPAVVVYKEELNKLIKKYKKIKKYTKSSIFEVKKMDGTEDYVSKLIEEATQDPPDI
jgi:DNA integrity scanning protein DisA with diadenylate cyclase activity